ncbi:MAG: hypothetical protein KC549_18670, partial [Myxococcales bacterium]|nr:hypothetical protein [Myxococcales bacterium]
MSALPILASLVVVAVVGWLLLRRPPPPPADDPDPAHRVEVLAAALTGDPARDRGTMNRLLALGPGIVPLLLAELSSALRVPDDSPPGRLARLEDVLSELGLAAVGPVGDALARVQPTSGLAGSLLRVIGRLGRPGVVALIQRTLRQ